MPRGATHWAVPALLLLLCVPSLATRQNATVELEQQGEGVVVARLVPGSMEGYELVQWGPRALCSPGSYAIAFQLKVEPIMLLGDFTALNGIKLYCLETGTGRLDLKITSSLGPWGMWGSSTICGLATQVRQALHIFNDDVSLVSAAFYCCSE